MAIFKASLAAALGLALLVSPTWAAPVSEPGCTSFAAPAGKDSWPGSSDRPFQSAQRLADTLAPGDVGCLREGDYVEDVRVTGSGSAAAPIVIRSHPGESATIVGRLVIEEGANFVTIANLNLDGRNAGDLPSPTINGDDARFVGNDVTNANTSICFVLGSVGRVFRIAIEYNRVHHCGRLPATNLEHGIYVEHAADVAIVGNVIHDNADRGVQLYPDARSTYVAGNVIDGNGEGVLIGGGEEGVGSWTSSGNVVEHNMITFSRVRYNVESHWGGWASGAANVVRRNCIFGGARDSDNHGLGTANGFTSFENVLADPLYANRGANDYRLAARSPCLGLDSGGPPSGATPAPHVVPGVITGNGSMPPSRAGNWRAARIRALRSRRARRARSRKTRRRAAQRKRSCALCGRAFVR